MLCFVQIYTGIKTGTHRFIQALISFAQQLTHLHLTPTRSSAEITPTTQCNAAAKSINHEVKKIYIMGQYKGRRTCFTFSL